MTTIKHIEIDKETGLIIEFYVNIESNTYYSCIKRTFTYHSCNDKPAVVYSTGVKFWFNNGELIKVVYPNGEKLWYKNWKCIKIESTNGNH